MKILIITYDYPYGTAETFLETEIKYASRFFSEITILSTSRNMSLTRNTPDNVRAIKVNRKYHLIECMLYAIIKTFCSIILRKDETISNSKFLKKIKAQLTYFAIERRLYRKVKEEGLYGKDYVAYSYWFAEGAFFLGCNCNLWGKTVSRVHSYEVWKETINPFLQKTCNSIDAIFCISNETERMLLEKVEELNFEKVYIQRLGIEHAYFCSKTKTSKEYCIVSCSSIYPLKRLDLIVETISKLHLDKPIKWIHFGGGVDQKKIERLCAGLFRDLEISWEITGWIPNEKVLEFYRNNDVDLFLNLSDNEGIPVSIMEAISFGIPCVARDVGGNREIVNDNTGLLLKKDISANEAALSIEKLLERNLNTGDISAFFEKHYCAEKNYSSFYSFILQ